jgi:outer membrane protein OmpA-like peptidoglycan-associated protein
MVFGASLLGIATASCVPEPRSAQGATPKSVHPGHGGGAEDAPSGGGGTEPSTERVPRPSDADTTQASAASSNARSASTVVAIYGGSSVAIHDEIEYTSNSLVIDAAGERTLVALKDVLDAFDCDILIQGHAGRDETNAAEWLSKRRAELVRERLIALGVDGSRLSVEVHGASALGATRLRALGRDRRVSFWFHAGANSNRRACDEFDRRKP